MATVTVVRYKRRKRISDADSPMVFALKPKSGESKIYSIEALAREIETIGSLSVEDVSHVMKSFVRAMKKVLVAGNKVKVEGLGIFYTTLTCPGGIGERLHREKHYPCQSSFQSRQFPQTGKRQYGHYSWRR